MRFSCNYLRKMSFSETSLVLQWLRLHIFTAGSTGSIPGGRTKIPHATRPGQKKNFLMFNAGCRMLGAGARGFYFIKKKKSLKRFVCQIQGFSLTAVLNKYLNAQLCRFLIRTNDLISQPPRDIFTFY